MNGWNRLCRAGGVAALILCAYSLATIVQIVMLGGEPQSAAEMFDLLHRDRLVALLRLDLPTLFVVPLYGFLFLGLWAAMRSRTLSLIAAGVAIAGLALFLSGPTPFSMIPLADQYAAATSTPARTALLHAGEAYLASDMWHGAGAIVGGFMIEAAAFLACIAMLQTHVFHRSVAWLGLAVHGLDALHLVAMPIAPGVGAVLMMIAGPFHPVWLFLVGRKLIRKI